MRNNVSSTSLKSLLDSYDRDAAANSRKKISTVGNSGAAGMKTSSSSLASNIQKDSTIPAITASDAKSMMNEYYKPYLYQAKAAAAAEKEAEAAAKKAAKSSSSSAVSDPYADGSKKDKDFWNSGKDDTQNKKQEKPEESKAEEKKPGLLAKAAGLISGITQKAKGIGEKVNNKVDEIKKTKDEYNKSSNETFTKYNEYIQQGDNRKLVNTLNALDEIQKNQQSEVSGADTNRAELENTLKQFTPEQIEQANELRKEYSKIPGYRIYDRVRNTVTGTGKTVGSGALMAYDSAKQHIDDSAVNWENDQLQNNKAELENVNAQIQEMQNFGNAYVMDENGSIADENGNLAYTPEFEALLNRKQELETKIQEDTVANPVSKDTSGYKLYQSAQEDLARSDLGLSDTAKTLKGAATSAAENIAIAAVNPALVLPTLSLQGAAGSMGEDVSNEVPAGTTLVKGAAKFAAGYAINSVGVEQMLNTMGVDGARNTLAAQIVRSIKSNSALAQSNPVFYATLAGAGDNGLQSFAEYWADRAIDLATNTAQPKSMEQLLTESLSEMGSGVLGGAFTGLTGSAVNVGRQYVSKDYSKQQSANAEQQSAQQETVPLDPLADTYNLKATEQATGEVPSPVEQTANEDLLTYGLLDNQISDTNKTVQPTNDYDLLSVDETSVNDNPNTHTDAQMNRINDYKQSVDPGMVEFIENTRKGNYTAPYVVAETSDRMRSAMQELTGMDTVGNVIVLDDNGVRHIDNRHGTDGAADKTMAKTEDMARAGYVLQNFDNAYLATDKAEGYVTKNGKRAPIIIFDKKIDGTHIVVEAVSDSKRNRNYIVSEYLSKNGVDKEKIARAWQSPMDAGNTDPRHTSETLAATTLANQIIPQEVAPVNEDLLTYGLLDNQLGAPADKGDGGYGANTVGAAESKFDNTPGKTVPSQTHGMQQSLQDGGATQGEAEMLANGYTHEQISVGKQRERADQLVNEQGIQGIVDDYTDMVSRGEVLNDEQSATALTAIEQLQNSIKSSSTDETAKMEAMVQRDRLMNAVAANNTTVARTLGYQGNRVKGGIDYATAAHGAVNKIADSVIKKHGGDQAVQKTEVKVKQAVDNAKAEAIDRMTAEVEQRIAEAENNLTDAKDRLRETRKEVREAEGKANRAEKYAKKRLEKAGEKFAKSKFQIGSAEEQVARKVLSASKDSVSNDGDATSRMVRELFKLSEETATKGNKTSNKPTIYQLLNEALFNRQAYSDTLNKAKELVAATVKNENGQQKDGQPNLDNWLGTDTDIGETVSKDTISKAITQTILETDGNVKELTKKLAFAEYGDVVDEVTNYILEQSGLNAERAKYQNEADYADNYGALEPVSAEEQNARKNLAEIDQQANFIREIVESELSRKVQGNSEYVFVTDKAARNAVKELIGNNNLREMVKQSNGDVNILRQYVTRILTQQYGITERSATKAADTVTRVYNDLVSEAIDKNMRQLLPELYKNPKTKNSANQHSAIEKFIEVAKMGQYTSDDVKALIASKWGITGLTTEQTNRIIELGDEMAAMKEKNSKAFWDKKAEMEDIIADGMGHGTWADAIASWPYVSMLSGIPKTGGKNVIGNVVLGGMTKVKNATVRPFLEFAAHKLSGGKYERTTANMLLSSKAQQRRSAAYQAYLENAYGLLKSPGKRDTTGALSNATFGSTTQDVVRNAQSKRKVFADKAGFIGKAAQKLADVENAVYGAQDEYGAIGTLEVFSFLPENSRIRNAAEGFMTSHADKSGKKGKIGISGVQNQFIDALSREMAAHNIDSYDQLMANREQADQMIQRAAQQANEATLHDVNVVSNRIMNASRTFGVVGKALNPFAKTSANIAVRGTEYSPLGVIEAAVKAKNGDYTTAIDALSKSITGTALMALGALAFHEGLITIKADDGDKDKYEANTSGKQKYSIEIGQFLHDLGVEDAPENVSLSLDSLSVGAMPFFMGAGIAEGMKDEEKSSAIGNAMLSLWDPLSDMTILSGLTDLIQSIQNAQSTSDAAGVIAENIGMGYLGEYIPTGLKQIGRAVSQPTRKSYYSDQNDSVFRAIDFDLTGMKNWIPGMAGEDYVDQLGRTQDSVGGNFLGRLAYNTLSPFTINYSKPSEVDDFLDLVYEQTKKDSVYPDMPTKHASTEVWNGEDKEKYRLSKTEMTTFAKTSGKATEEMLKSLEDLGGILDMGGDNIADIQSDLYATARNIGYLDAIGDRYAGGESDEMKNNMTVYEKYGSDGLVKYLAGKKAFSAIKNSEDVQNDVKNYAEVLDSLTPSMVSTYMESNKNLYQAYKEHGAGAMAAYEMAGDRYNKIKDNGGKYVDAVLSLDNMSKEEMGYIYSLHSGDNTKAAYLYDYFDDESASKLAYWFLRYSAAKETWEHDNQSTRRAWANQTISDAWERETFLYLSNTARKDWKIN